MGERAIWQGLVKRPLLLLAGLVAAALIAACSTGPEPTATPTMVPPPSAAPIVIPQAPGATEDSRPIVALPDGGTGAIDNWEVTASFDKTIAAPGFYGYREIYFRVHIRWTGTGGGGEWMDSSFLRSHMQFVSPSGRIAAVYLWRFEHGRPDPTPVLTPEPTPPSGAYPAAYSDA